LSAQVHALAAVVEAARLVEQLAREGTAPVADMEALLAGVFRFEWDTPEEVFGEAALGGRGLALLETLLRDPAAPAQRALLRNVLGLLHLGRLLARDRAMLGDIRARLQHAALGSAHFGTGFDTLTARVAAIYQDTVSTCAYRIRVNGNAQYLQDPRVAARIRALLLAGLRAVVLWRHCGGSRAALLLGRRRLLGACVALRRARS
jgi:high frequency lysogenization protein